MIAVNVLINNAFQRCSLVDEDDVPTGSQQEAGLQDLHSLIAEMNTENDLLCNYQTYDSLATKKFKFAKKPDRWFEVDNLEEINTRINDNQAQIGDIYKLKNPNNGYEFYTIRSFVVGEMSPFSTSEWNKYMKDKWANVWVEEIPDRVLACSRRIANRWQPLMPSNKVKIDSLTQNHLPTQYCCETELVQIHYPHNEGIDPEYEIEYFVVETDSIVPTEYRMTVLEGIPQYTLKDTIKVSSKYESLIEDGLCVKLCKRYKLLELVPVFEADYESARRAIKTINHANRPEVYDFVGNNSWDVNYSNFVGGAFWG